MSKVIRLPGSMVMDLFLVDFISDGGCDAKEYMANNYGLVLIHDDEYQGDFLFMVTDEKLASMFILKYCS